MARASRSDGGSQDRPGIEDARVAAVCGLDDPVRRKLYDYVSQRGQAVGRDEAAAGIGIGRSLAAYHLDKLCDLGLLTASYQRPAWRRGPGAGRPAKLYARSGSEFAVTVPPREYELAGRLLAHAVDADPSGQARTVLGRAAQGAGADLGKQALERGQAGSDAQQMIMSVLAQHGFEPWSDDAGAIRLRNCPFPRLAASYPDVVCGMNLALLEGLLDGLGEPGLRAALDPRPRQCCVLIQPIGAS
jgi:predicted ArsR family transcriptional regulator